MIWTNRWWITVSLLAGLIVQGRPVVGAQSNVSLLMVGFACPEQDEYLRALASQGFDCDRCEFKEISEDKLKAFQVVVLADVGQPQNDYTEGPQLKKSYDLLQKYIENGGSVFANMYYGQGWHSAMAACNFANRFGADFNLSTLRDPETEVTATAWQVLFGYTENVPKSPVSDGIKGVWYPLTAGGFGMASCCGGMKLSKEWIPLLYAGRSAQQVLLPTGIPVVDKRSNVPSAAPYCLLAGRQVGKGRVAITNIPHGFTISSGTAPALEVIVLDKGLRAKPSDLGKLYVNLYRWLAEPARAAGIGGAPNKFLPPDPAKDRKAPPPPAGPVIWDKFQFPTPKQWVGIVGARTSLSVGKGTVHDYCVKAKAAGLNFIAFTEDFASLTPAELKQLTAECKKESDDSFIAVPGFIIADDIGDHFFVLGTDLKPPDADLLTADGKMLSVNADKHPDWKQGVGDVWIEYFYSRLGFKGTVGSCLHKTGVPYYDYRDYQAVAIVTRENGKVLDDLTDGYLDLQASGQNLQAYALELMNSPADVERVAKTGYRTVIMDNDWIHKCTLATHWDTWHCTYASFPQLITNGPQVVQWERMASHDYWAEGDRWHAGYYESRIRGAVKSEVGLKDIRIYDNGQLVRRYSANTAKEYAVEFKFTREKQHGFVMIAEDVNGGRAITGTYNTQNNQFEEFMCGDRNNQLAYGSGWWPDGTFFKLAIGTTPATPNKGPWNSLIFGCGPYKWDPKVGVGVSTFDGSPESDPLFNIWPGLYTDPKNEDGALHMKANRLLVSADVMVGEGLCDGAFPKGYSPTNVWHSVAPVQPTQLAEASRRFTLWNTLAGGPVCYVIEGQTGVKQPVKLTQPFEVATVDSRAAQGWSIRDGQGRYVSGHKLPGEIKSWVAGSFGSGACASFYDCSLGAVALASLSDGLQYMLDSPTASRLWIKGTTPDKTMSPGQPFRYRMLLASWPRTTLPTDEMTDRFLSAYGLSGKPPIYSLTVEAGKVLDQHFVLAVEGSEAGFAGAVKKCDLPTYLCVMVSGMNDKWTAGYLDRARKRYRGVGLLQGTAYAQIDTTRSDEQFFIGHPVTCENKEVLLNAMQTGNGSFHVEVHNPTDKAVTVNLKVSPVMAELIQLPKTPVEVPAGSSVVVLEAKKQ